jgi:septum site-determining protein MinC
MALVLAPEAPVADWLGELDAQIERSPSFFAGRPVVVDLAAVPAQDPSLPGLIPELQARGIRIIAVENADPTWQGAEKWGRPLTGGRAISLVRPPEEPKAPDPTPPAEPAEPEETSLLISENVRSGQSILFPKGDVTIIGSIASGAEVIAGGSIHVYGALRGRAIAGFTGNGNARIFCRRMHAELVSIDGLYRTADELDQKLRGRACQVWLTGEQVNLAALD